MQQENFCFGLLVDPYKVELRNVGAFFSDDWFQAQPSATIVMIFCSVAGKSVYEECEREEVGRCLIMQHRRAERERFFVVSYT